MGDKNIREFSAVGSNPEIEHQIFNSFAENSTEFFGVSDLDLRPIYVNPAGLKIVGLDSFAKTNVLDFFFPEDIPFINDEFFPRVLQDGHGETEIRFRHFKTGEPIWMIYTVFIVCDKQGESIGYGTISRDINERKKGEEENKLLSERNINILESITDAFLAIDKDWRFTYTNKQAEQLLNCQSCSLTGKIIWDEYPGLLGSEFEKAYRRTMTEGVSTTATAYYPDHQRWYEVRVYSAANGITIYFRNITERIESEEMLKKVQEETERQRRLYDTVLSNSPDLSYVFDLNHRFIYANDILLKMWGKTWDEAIGKNCLELGYEPWHAEMHDREIEQVVATKKPIRGEVPFNGTFGRRMYDYIFVPIFGDDGEVEAVAGTTRDVTERKSMEDRNRFIMEIDEAVRPLETPEEITITLARLLGEYLGADRCAYAEVEGDEDHFYIPGDYTRGDTFSIVGNYSMASFGAEVLRLMRENKPYVVDDVDTDPQVTPEDLAAYRQTQIQAVICVPLHKNGRFAACMAVHQRHPRRWRPEEIELVSFVSHRFWESIERARVVKSLNDSLIREQEARQSAEEANRVKDEFLATLSHELRTPLNAILGWSTMLRSGQVDEKTSVKALETIERNARAQSQLIEDILDISRIITGKLRLEIAPVELSKVIEAAVESMRPAAQAKEIRLQVLLDSEAGSVSGDATRLQQVIWNLISNAVKFTPRNGRVQIRLERVNSHVEIIVGDTGRGIDREFLPFIFDRFRQADQTTTRKQGGLGLGLSIVKQLVEMHGGTIQAESEGEGKGSSFTVKLPRLIAVSRSKPSQEERVHPTVSEHFLSITETPELIGLRILIVDDEPDSLELLRRILEDRGSDVISASSAAEAFSKIQNNTFDVLVSDIGMPEEDGYTLIGKVRRLPLEKGGRILAIALTAYARVEDRVRALNAGFQAHLPKPIEPVELVAVISSLAKRLEKNSE